MTESTTDERRFNARLFWLQSAAREILVGNRVGVCCRVVVPGKNVQVWGDVKRKKAKYRNVIRCASIWNCPVCSNNITAHRRNDVQFVIDKLSKTCVTVMISFTVQHDRRDSLDETLDVVTTAWRRMVSCRRWSLLKNRGHLLGYVRALEVTWGERNGWHPHIHCLFFLTPEACIASFYKDTRQWWESSVDEAGGYSRWEYACNLTVCDGSIAEYLTKWGHEPTERTRERLNNWGKARELTRGGIKHGKDGHLTPFDMMELYITDTDKSPAFWGKLVREYSAAMKGNKQLVWSRNPDLRKKVGLDTETPEAEIVEGTEAGYYLLATINESDWRAIMWADAAGTVLDCAARGDLQMMRDLISDYVSEHSISEGKRQPLTKSRDAFTLVSVNKSS